MVNGNGDETIPFGHPLPCNTFALSPKALSSLFYFLFYELTNLYGVVNYI